MRRTAPGDATEATPDVGQVDVRIDITPSTAILPERAEIGISIDVSSSTATRKYVITIQYFGCLFNKHPGELHNQQKIKCYFQYHDWETLHGAYLLPHF